MPLSLGTWQANVNGSECSLMIDSLDQQMNTFSGRLGLVAVTGFWNESAQIITFSFNQLPSSDGILNVAIFTGYLFRTPINPEPGRDVVATLAGFVQSDALRAYSGNNLPIIATARRNIFGWYAQITEIQ